MLFSSSHSPLFCSIFVSIVSANDMRRNKRYPLTSLGSVCVRRRMHSNHPSDDFWWVCENNIYGFLRSIWWNGEVFFTQITIENNPRRALNGLVEAMSTSSSVWRRLRNGEKAKMHMLFHIQIVSFWFRMDFSSTEFTSVARISQTPDTLNRRNRMLLFCIRTTKNAPNAFDVVHRAVPIDVQLI